MTVYNFVIEVLNSDILAAEIRASAITVALDHIDSSGSDVSIVFKSSLSEPEISILAAIAAAHAPLALPLSDFPIVRSAITKTGWHYEPRVLQFSLGKTSSLRSQNPSGSSKNDATLHFWDANGDELLPDGPETEEAFAARVFSSATKTLLRWEPAYDRELIGGSLQVRAVPTVDIMCWALIAPDIPSNLGGSVPFIDGGLNLSFLGQSRRFDMNGRGAKLIKYDPVHHSGAMAIVVLHPANTDLDIQMIFEQYKE